VLALLSVFGIIIQVKRNVSPHIPPKKFQAERFHTTKKPKPSFPNLLSLIGIRNLKFGKLKIDLITFGNPAYRQAGFVSWRLLCLSRG
jgi:hypothetical protein